MDSLAYLEPSTENPTTEDPTTEYPACTRPGQDGDPPDRGSVPVGESDAPGRTPGAPPPNVADVLGVGVAAEEPPGPSRLRRSLTAVRATLAVLARPRVAGVLVFGLGVLIILLVGYVYVFTPLSAAARAAHPLP